MSNTIPYIKKNAPWIVAGLLLLIIMLGSGFGYKYHQDQLKPLDSLKNVLIERDKAEVERIMEIMDSVSSLEYDYENFYDDYIREKARRQRLEREMRSIINMRFNRAYLDSIADHYEYR